MIYIFESNGKCVCKTHRHFNDIKDIHDDICTMAKSHNGTYYIDHAVNYDINKVQLINGEIKIITEKPSNFHKYNYDLNEWKIDEIELYNSKKLEANKFLKESDYTQYPDIQEELTEEQKTAWKEYRKKLRNFPKNYDELLNYELPEKPE